MGRPPHRPSARSLVMAAVDTVTVFEGFPGALKSIQPKDAASSRAPRFRAIDYRHPYLIVVGRADRVLAVKLEVEIGLPDSPNIVHHLTDMDAVVGGSQVDRDEYSQAVLGRRRVNCGIAGGQREREGQEKHAKSSRSLFVRAKEKGINGRYWCNPCDERPFFGDERQTSHRCRPA